MIAFAKLPSLHSVHWINITIVSFCQSVAPSLLALLKTIGRCCDDGIHAASVCCLGWASVEHSTLHVSELHSGTSSVVALPDDRLRTLIKLWNALIAIVFHLDGVCILRRTYATGKTGSGGLETKGNVGITLWKYRQSKRSFLSTEFVFSITLKAYWIVLYTQIQTAWDWSSFAQARFSICAYLVI